MNKTILQTLAAVILSSACLIPSMESFEIPQESVSNFSLPSNFNLKKLYEWNSSVLFKTDSVLFAQGTFNKKFSLKTPYGKTISTTRIYELVPNNRPFLVVRDDEGHVLGFVQLENYRRTQLFKPVTGIVYDKYGKNILKTYFPLGSKYCHIYSVANDSYQLLASTEKGVEGDFSVHFSASYQDFGLDPIFLLSLLHIHADKSLLVDLADHVAIDDIDINELATYAQKTDGEKWIKSLPLPAQKEDVSEWINFKEKLEDVTEPVQMSDEEVEAIAISLAVRFDREDSSTVQLLKNSLEAFSNEEKSVLLQMLKSRLGF